MFDLIKNAFNKLKNNIIKEKSKPKASLKLKKSIIKDISSYLSKTYKIEEKELGNAMEELELMLIEADTSYAIAEKIVNEVKHMLVGKEVNPKDLDNIIYNAIDKVLNNVLNDKIDLIALIKEKLKHKKPVVILFFGINGVGKTTAIAKLANLLQKNGLKTVIAAADTFRKGAIEQLQVWGDKVGIKIIRRDYGHSPASVVYDAIEHAKAKHIDVVVVDTAGRQEVNLNLMKELEKVKKVANPDFNIFVAEAIAGNAAYDQIKKYNELIGIDGIILTKTDIAKKGGIVLSLTYETGLPIYYITYGQGLDDIKVFDKKEVIKDLRS